MTFHLMATEDLKDKILELKKCLHTVTSENYLLKVKVRKLQTELDKKDKQLENLLDPNKTSCIRKIVSERGATMIITLKDRINNLEDELKEKNNIIKKLNLNLQISKLYLPKESTTFTRSCDNKHISVKQKECIHNNKFRSRSLTVTPVPRSEIYLKSSSDIKMEYVRLAQNLQKIKSANSVYKQRSPDNADQEKTKNTVENVLANSSVLENNKTKNIEKCFENMAQDMEKLKYTVTHLTQEQEYTKKILKDKNRNIEILARKVKHLQKHKSIKSSPQKSLLNNTEQNKKMSFPSSSTNSYSQESFEEEISNENIDITLNESPKDISEDIGSDDDDVQTGDSK